MSDTHFNPAYPGTPIGKPQEINLKDMGPILTLLIKNPELRKLMFEDVAATLAKLNYVPHDEVVAFFTSLKGADFEAAATAFKPAHPDPSLGMAEC